MSSEREPQLIVATGSRGVGKTYTTCKLIEDYLTPDLSANKKARKVLIFDVNMEYTNTELEKNGHRFRTKILALKDLEEWVSQKSIEVRRILPVDLNGNPVGVDKMSDILNVILHFYRGGLLILEDINRYLTDTKDAHIIGTLATNRHRDLDILIHLQSLSPVTTRMWQNLNAVRFHYQNDPVHRIKARIPNYELFSIAQLLVNNQHMKGDVRFNCYVLIDKNKIRGKFSKRQFIEACRNHIDQHPQDFSMVYLTYPKTAEGRMAALKYCVKGLIAKYYGNPEPVKHLEDE